MYQQHRRPLTPAVTMEGRACVIENKGLAFGLNFCLEDRWGIAAGRGKESAGQAASPFGGHDG